MLHRRHAGLAISLALLAASPAAAEDVVVTQYGAAFAGAPFAVAIDGGFFKRAGLDITAVIAGAGGGSSVRNVLASSLGYGKVVVSAAVAAIQENQDLRIVNIGARSVADIALVVMPNSPIRSLKDLAGKKFGVSNPKSLSEIVAILSVEKAGLKDEQVQRIHVGSLGGALTALEQGAVDVAVALPVVWASRAGKYRVLLNVKDDLPPMAQSVGIASGELMRKNPEKLRAIIKARREAVAFMHANPKETVRIFGKHYDKIPADVLERVMATLIDDRYWSEGRLERDRLDAMARGMKLVGEFKGGLDWSRFADGSFLPKDLQN